LDPALAMRGSYAVKLLLSLSASRRKSYDHEEVAMNALKIMRSSQAGKFARFLDEHPGFSPQLIGENAYVCGFRMGESLLSIDEMETLIDTPVDQQTAALLRTLLTSAKKARQ